MEQYGITWNNVAFAQHEMQFRYDEAIPIEHRCHTLSK